MFGSKHAHIINDSTNKIHLYISTEYLAFNFKQEIITYKCYLFVCKKVSLIINFYVWALNTYCLFVNNIYLNSQIFH